MGGKDVTTVVSDGIFERLYVLPLARVNCEYFDCVYWVIGPYRWGIGV